jgi:hypothetical protein
MYVGLHVKYRPTLMKLEFYRFGQTPHFKFHENPSSGRRFVPYGRTDESEEEIDIL